MLGFVLGLMVVTSTPPHQTEVRYLKSRDGKLDIARYMGRCDVYFDAQDFERGEVERFVSIFLTKQCRYVYRGENWGMMLMNSKQDNSIYVSFPFPAESIASFTPRFKHYARELAASYKRDFCFGFQRGSTMEISGTVCNR